MKRFLVLLPLLALLSGCGSNPNRRVELNENTGQLLPVSALAMDTHKRGYTMTVESIRQDSLNGDAAPAYFTVEGQTFDELFQRADELLASRLYLSHAQAVMHLGQCLIHLIIAVFRPAALTAQKPCNICVGIYRRVGVLHCHHVKISFVSIAKECVYIHGLDIRLDPHGRPLRRNDRSGVDKGAVT